MYLDVIFISPSIIYNKEAQYACAMAANGLLTNNITEIDKTPWAGALLGEDRDWDLVANVNAFATECHLLHVDSLFKTSLGSKSRKASQPQEDACPLFITDPSIINLGLNLEVNITASVSRHHVVSPNHLVKVWRIDVEAAKKMLDITTQLRKHEIDGLLTKNFSTNGRMLRY